MQILTFFKNIMEIAIAFKFVDRSTKDLYM